MSGLYAAAEALVMPTFFGPTNVPVVQAWAFGCPMITRDMITRDIRGIREQAGDAALLADPRSIEAIVDGSQRLWTDRTLRVASYTPTDFRLRLGGILENARRLLSEAGQ
jgi:glycosyltransferase involved in cell wall biosynthesis